MSPLVTALSVVVLLGATSLVLAGCATLHYSRRLSFFRCRVGRSRARWSRRRTSAAWVENVLLVRSGVLRLWITPFAVGSAGELSLEPADVRGLGPRPVAMRFTLLDDREVEIAVAGVHADRLVGPFLTAALSPPRNAPRERGG